MVFRCPSHQWRFIVNRTRFKLITPRLRVRMLNHFTTSTARVAYIYGLWGYYRKFNVDIFITPAMLLFATRDAVFIAAIAFQQRFQNSNKTARHSENNQSHFQL